MPFENLDIQYKTGIILDREHLFKKVVKNFRGGFCYEVNYLFALLLIELGFHVTIISAQILDGQELGPEYDHMALIVILNGKNLLVDVGFGDLFIKPLEIDDITEQFDGRNYFIIKNLGEKTFLLSMSKNGINYENKYIFKNESKTIEDFSQQCLFKELSPSSYFVKNKIITLPVSNGRKTIFNSKFIVKINDTKTEQLIENIKEEKRILQEEFKIRI